LKLPFTIEQFLGVFERYNLAVWPAQIFLVLLGALAINLAIRRKERANRAVPAVLGVLWLWMGAVYHLGYFTGINKAAYLFGALFIIQAFVFMSEGISRRRLSFQFKPDINGWTGALFILYGMAIYPALNQALGHGYPKSPTFGLPCPTTIFTFGILLWADRPIPKYILVIPILWAVVGLGAAISLGMLEDFGLTAAAVIGSALIWIRDKKGLSNFQNKT
jgi:hypothetical protein